MLDLSKNDYSSSLHLTLLVLLGKFLQSILGLIVTWKRNRQSAISGKKTQTLKYVTLNFGQVIKQFTKKNVHTRSVRLWQMVVTANLTGKKKCWASNFSLVTNWTKLWIEVVSHTRIVGPNDKCNYLELNWWL